MKDTDKIDHFNCIKLKSFYINKMDITKKTEEVFINWENIFSNISDKGLLSKRYRQLTEIYKAKRHSPIGNGQRI